MMATFFVVLLEMAGRWPGGRRARKAALRADQARFVNLVTRRGRRCPLSFVG